MKKIKKSDLRYGDVVKFAAPVTFSGRGVMAQSFEADTFLVDVLPPKRGKKTPEYELRLPAHPERVCEVKKWGDFEVIARLPENVQVFKTRSRNYPNSFMRSKHMVLRPNGQTVDEKMIVAHKAMAAAYALGKAAVVFRAFGYAEVWPLSDAPTPEFLQQQMEAPIASDQAQEGNEKQFSVLYAAGADSRAHNETAYYALHRDVTELDYNPPEDMPVGNVIVLVGFQMDAENQNVPALAQASD